jgi:hypothetical protein
MCVVTLGLKHPARKEQYQDWRIQMGQCVACGKETLKILFRKAAVPIFVCSEACLQKYFKPIGGVDVPQKLAQSESWLD